MRTRGFTLIELTLVLAVIGILASLAVTGYQGSAYRARAAEARSTLEAIAHAERLYFRDHGRYLPCGPSATEVPRGVAAAFDNGAPGWRELGLRVDEPVRYRYEVRQEPAGFVAVAQGDLNGNGKPSTFSLALDTLVLDVRDELE